MINKSMIYFIVIFLCLSGCAHKTQDMLNSRMYKNELRRGA